MEKIDFVIPWVDGSDENWQREKKKYFKGQVDEKLELQRYLDWGLLKYWFRGVEKFAPWVGNIYFVTWGHLPSWLNLDNPKLRVVKHSDYIPEEFLPTFSSHPIELNLHRIEGLSERFVYFNDDIFLIDYVEEEVFFKGGLPCDTAIIQPVYPSSREDGFYHILSNDLALINVNFKKREVVNKNIFKWFNLRYKKYLPLNFYFYFINKFEGFRNFHLANSFRKSTLEEVWEREYDKLYESSTHKFRANEDVNQYIFSYWQFAKGEFHPRKHDVGMYFMLGENSEEIYKSIIGQKYKMICINDTRDKIDFEAERARLEEAFEKILGEKSSFEK